MTEPTSVLSNRERKRRAREVAQNAPAARSESTGSDTTKKEERPSSTLPIEPDSEMKVREGVNPFVEVVQKKIRNLTKRKVSPRGGRMAEDRVDSS